MLELFVIGEFVFVGKTVARCLGTFAVECFIGGIIAGYRISCNGSHVAEYKIVIFRGEADILVVAPSFGTEISFIYRDIPDWGVFSRSNGESGVAVECNAAARVERNDIGFFVPSGYVRSTCIIAGFTSGHALARVCGSAVT